MLFFAEEGVSDCDGILLDQMGLISSSSSIFGFFER